MQSRDDEIVSLAVRNGVLVRGAASEHLVEEASAVLSVRPESVRVRVVDRGDEHAFDGPRADAGELTGVVSQVVYLGNRLRVGVDIGEEAVVWADLRDEEAVDLTEGVRVALSWRPSATSVWAQDTEGEETER